MDDYVLNVFTGSGGKGRFDLIPSDIYLSSVLRGISIGPFDLNVLINEKARNEYQYILIDCAPTYSSLTTIALNTCKAVLIPMIADSFGFFGTQLMKQIIEEHQYDFGVEVKVIGVVFTMRDRTATGTEYENKIITEWGAQKVFRPKSLRTNSTESPTAEESQSPTQPFPRMEKVNCGRLFASLLQRCNGNE